MLCIAKPSQELISEFLEKQSNSKLSYSLEKATLDHATKQGFSLDERFKLFDVDEHNIKLGSGEDCFKRAVEGLKAWKHFNMNWVEVCFPDTSIQVGRIIGICAKSAGVWTLSACKIVYLIDDLDPNSSFTSSNFPVIPNTNSQIKRFGFAYGTLETHVARGEGRFMIEYDTISNDVYFRILEFSQPNSWFTKIGYPFARYVQNSFGKSATQALKDWVSNSEIFSAQHGKQELAIV